jgi:DNA-binding NarL/FixJ family response regulator
MRAPLLVCWGNLLQRPDDLGTGRWLTALAKHTEMNNSVIKILLLGDYSIFRSALRMLIETDKKFRVIGEATDIHAASEIVEEERPDLILVDLPEKDGHEQLASFHSADVPVLVLIGQYDVDVYQKCLRLGISGLVPKEGRSETLFRAIDRVFNGEIWFDRTIMGHTIRQLIEEKSRLGENPRGQAANSLTDREQQVVALICQGMKNKEIADELFITETTVRHHLTSVFNKFEISSRLELVVHAFKHNLVAVSPANGKNGSSGNGRNGGNGSNGNGHNGNGNGNGNGKNGRHRVGAFIA